MYGVSPFICFIALGSLILHIRCIVHSFTLFSSCAQCLLYARHQKSKDELNKFFARILQCRKMWDGMRQVRKLCKYPKRRQIICGECLKEGEFIFSKRNLEASWRDWHFSWDVFIQELNTCYLAFAVPGIKHSLVNKIHVLPAFTELIKA